jgi:hypothetical protein
VRTKVKRLASPAVFPRPILARLVIKGRPNISRNRQPQITALLFWLIPKLANVNGTKKLLTFRAEGVESFLWSTKTGENHERSCQGSADEEGS